MTTKTFSDVQWQDEDLEAVKQTSSQTDVTEEDFASMLANEDQELLSQPTIRVGQKISGVIATISDSSDDVLVDLGAKSAGILAKQELQEQHGIEHYKVGDQIEAFVVSRKGAEVTLSLSQMRSVKSFEELQDAYRQRIPVRGKVTAVNKGGFEVSILGKSAFCPISQISNHFVEMPQEFVGQELDFLIDSLDGKGRNIVVSRNKLLKLKAAERLGELRSSVADEKIFDGVVTRLETYGAFVDLEGIEGLIHISEMSFSRIKHPSDVIDKGEKVRVSILRIEGNEDKPRISLSLKATLQDPWEQIGEAFQIGNTYPGVVTKLLKSGAIITLKAGVDGYLHVSEMAWGKRIHDPASVIQEGQSISVSILDLDPLEKKIRLSMRAKEDDPWQYVQDKFSKGGAVKASVSSLKGFGAIVELMDGIEGFVAISAMKAKFGESFRKHCSPGKDLDLVVADIDMDRRRITCSFSGLDDQDEHEKNYQEYLRAEQSDRKKQTKVSGKAEMGSFGALLAAKLSEREKK